MSEAAGTGRLRRVVASLLDVKREPRRDAPLDTQLLCGELVEAWDEGEGWSCIRALRDGYRGYVLDDRLGPEGQQPTHRVVVNRTLLYPTPDMKQPRLGSLVLGGQIRVTATSGTYAQTPTGWIVASHLAPVADVAGDWVALAETFIGAPYLWGGKSVGGIDCSGLVQLTLEAAGVAMPRNTGDQVGADGWSTLEQKTEPARGDLVFWHRHVGVMIDNELLLHANGHHMLVMRESLATAVQRIASSGGGAITAHRRRDPN